MTRATTLTLKNDPSELVRVTRLVASLCAENAIPADAEYDINLTLDEIVSNVIRHAYPDGRVHEFTLRVAVDKDEFWAQVEDDGREFNPTEHPAPDLDAPLAERKAGGLGVHIVRSIMDSFEYECVAGKNLVTVRKKLGGTAEKSPDGGQP